MSAYDKENTIKDCSECINCCGLRGFMAVCHCSYNEKRQDGSIWHIQSGGEYRRDHAEKCPHYTIEQYDRDEFFIL